LKSGVHLFEEEAKTRCPDCSQTLTFVRTKSHQKRWYCYSCEKYIDLVPELQSSKDAFSNLDALNGLQVIDSHGMIVGRVRKAVSNETGEIRSLVLSVDKEQFKNLLENRELPREFEVRHDGIATVGDVVILSHVFSPSALAPPKAPDVHASSSPKNCSKCGSMLLADAKHCIKCGASLVPTSLNCQSCGTSNPPEAKFCKNCGSRIP